MRGRKGQECLDNSSVAVGCIPNREALRVSGGTFQSTGLSCTARIVMLAQFSLMPISLKEDLTLPKRRYAMSDKERWSRVLFGG